MIALTLLQISNKNLIRKLACQTIIIWCRTSYGYTNFINAYLQLYIFVLYVNSHTLCPFDLAESKLAGLRVLLTHSILYQTSVNV